VEEFGVEMAALIHTATMSTLHCFAHGGIHHNLTTMVGLARGGPLKSNKLNGMRFSSLASFKLTNGTDNRQTLSCNSSMSFSNGSTADSGFSENDEDYINSSVMEAVEVKSGPDGFVIKMRDGHFVKCVHNNPDGGSLPDYGPQPAIVLQMDDASKLLLPIIVLELPCTMLIEAVRNVQVMRPTVYHVMRDMLEVMGYQAKLVRVTRRVHEAYYARIYLAKIGDETQGLVSLDLRPSDAINLAVRCKIPIQVNRDLAYGDGVRIVADPPKLPSRSLLSELGLFLTDLDRAEADSCAAAEEFALVRSMMIAAVEERYSDAAKLRDELRQLRSKKKRRQQKQF
jgi:bifunctional DNase/RNase